MRERVLLFALGALWTLPCLGGWIIDGQPTAPESGGSSGGITSVVVTVDGGTLPVLVLPLGGQWTDFELKATTNNFTNLVYYIKSSSTSSYENAGDTNVWTYFTDDYAADTRQWIKALPGSAICGQLANATNSVVEYAVVCPSHECARDWRGWMSATNNRLVWSFVRYDGIDLEKNVAGTKERWSPVAPVEWRAARVAP